MDWSAIWTPARSGRARLARADGVELPADRDGAGDSAPGAVVDGGAEDPAGDAPGVAPDGLGAMVEGRVGLAQAAASASTTASAAVRTDERADVSMTCM
jgi:hypothetical protein